jgi:hypothetical protein
MKWQKSKFYLSRWVVLSAAMALLTACGGGGGSGDSDIPDFDVSQYEKPVYLVGNLNDSPLGRVLNAAFPRTTALDGALSDRPLFLTGARLETLTDDIAAAIMAAKTNTRPIVLFHVTAAQINAVLAVVGEPADYALPDGFGEAIQNAEIFAIDFEEEGMVSRWATFAPIPFRNDDDDPVYTPDETVWEDSNALRAHRVNLFIDWMNVDGERMALLGAGQENAKQAFSTNATGNNLIDLSPPYTTINNFAYFGDLFQITHNVWTFHSFSEIDGVDYDWVYAEQNGILHSGSRYSRSKGYTYTIPPDFIAGNPTEKIHYYVDRYTTYNAFDNAESKNYLLLTEASPHNVNGVSTVTQETSASFGGQIGFAGKGAAGSLSMGMTITNSRTYNVADAAIENWSMASGHDAQWVFRFKQPEGYRHGFPQATYKLHDAPILARGVFQPSTSWLWRIDPRQRDIGSQFFTKFSVEYGWSEGSMGMFGYPDAYHHSAGGTEWSYNIDYKNPPLIVLPIDIDFNNTGSYKTIDLAVARDWTVSCDQPWCHVTPMSGNRNSTRINVTVDPNTTGDDRTAIVTAKTVDGKDQASMTVFQSRY